MQQNDAQLGNLKFDDQIGCWEGRVTLPSGASFTLYVHTSGNDRAITDAARLAFEKMRHSETEARQFAADELLPVHNDEWCEGKPIDAREFMRRLVPAVIQVWPHGSAEISFDDGDLFWGHEVGVRYRDGKFTEAVVQG